MILFLWFIIFAEICIVIYKKCIFERSKVEINHFFMFSLGFFFYFMLPILVLHLGMFQDEPGMSNLYILYNNIHKGKVVKLLISFWSIYSSFVFGSLLVEKRTKKKNKKLQRIKKVNKVNIKILLVCNMPILAYFIIVFRKSFMKGNLGQLSNATLRGTFVAYSLVFLAFSLFYTAYRYEKDTFLEKVCNPVSLIYIILALLLLSLGGRLYFISSIFMVFVFKSVYFKKIKIINLFLGLISCVFGAGTLGIVRMGIFKVKLSEVLFNVFAESLYTSYSLISFLSYDNVVKAFQMPKYLVSNFI